MENTTDNLQSQVDKHVARLRTNTAYARALALILENKSGGVITLTYDRAGNLVFVETKVRFKAENER